MLGRCCPRTEYFCQCAHTPGLEHRVIAAGEQHDFHTLRSECAPVGGRVRRVSGRVVSMQDDEGSPWEWFRPMQGKSGLSGARPGVWFSLQSSPALAGGASRSLRDIRHCFPDGEASRDSAVLAEAREDGAVVRWSPAHARGIRDQGRELDRRDPEECHLRVLAPSREATRELVSDGGPVTEPREQVWAGRSRLEKRAGMCADYRVDTDIRSGARVLESPERATVAVRADKACVVHRATRVAVHQNEWRILVAGA